MVATAAGCARRDAALRVCSEATLRDMEQDLDELDAVLKQVRLQEQAQTGYLAGD